LFFFTSRPLSPLPPLSLFGFDFFLLPHDSWIFFSRKCPNAPPSSGHARPWLFYPADLARSTGFSKSSLFWRLFPFRLWKVLCGLPVPLVWHHPCLSRFPRSGPLPAYCLLSPLACDISPWSPRLVRFVSCIRGAFCVISSPAASPQRWIAGS